MIKNITNYFSFLKKKKSQHEIHFLILNFASITRQIIAYLGRLITESNEEKFLEICKRIKVLEAKGDKLKKEILSIPLNLNNNHLLNYYQLITICNYLESIGDLARKTTSIYKKRKKTKSYITPILRTQLMYMQDKISMACTLLLQNLNEKEKVNIQGSLLIEKEINKIYKQTLKMLLLDIKKNKISWVSGIYYKEVIQIYELIGDYLLKANYILVYPTKK